MTIEYRLRPVIRFAITRYESTDNDGSLRTLGEYDNQDVAYEVGYALAKAETDRLRLQLDSMEVIYPAQLPPMEVNVKSDYVLNKLREHDEFKPVG